MLSLVGSAVWLLLGAVPAFADNGPHVSTAGMITDRCASCHRLHTAQAPMLLTQSQSTLCYTCHGASGTGATTDVEDGVGFSSATRLSATRAGALRGGGFKYALIDSLHPGNPTSTRSNIDGTVPALSPLTTKAPITSSHSVDGLEGTAWGNGTISGTASAGATMQLGCGSCHDPHGNGNYRILRPIPDQSGATTGVAIADAATKVYTTTNYWAAWDTNAPSFISSASAWCSQCHTRYLAGTGAGRESSGDAVFTYRHRSNDNDRGVPNCIQCHVAHGSNATMGPYSSALTNPGGTPATAGNSRLLRIDNRGTCQMCHNR